jgi:hypothetical protein
MVGKKSETGCWAARIIAEWKTNENSSNGNDKDRRVSNIVQEGKQNNRPTKKIENADYSEKKSLSLPYNLPAASVCVHVNSIPKDR